MLYLDITLEDTRIRAENFTRNQDGLWEAQLTDNLTRDACWNCLWSPEQLAAILVLAIVGDEHEGAKALYEIAEPAVAGIPYNLRPIP